MSTGFSTLTHKQVGSKNTLMELNTLLKVLLISLSDNLIIRNSLTISVFL